MIEGTRAELSTEIAVLQSELRSNREAMILAREVMEAKFLANVSVTNARLEHLNNVREDYYSKIVEWERKYATFFSKESHELYREIVEAELRSIRDWMSQQKGSASRAQVNTSFLVGILGLMLAAISIIVQVIHNK